MSVVLSKIINELKRVSFGSFSCLLVITLLLSGQAVQAKKMYRLVDEDGNVFFSDQVPPDQVKHRRESLNEKARVIEVLEKEKSKAQRELAYRLAILREQQEKVIAKQKADDRVLRSTFRSIDDMKLALTRRMLSFERQRKAVQGNLKRLEQQLQQQQKKAAQHERDNRKVPASVIAAISASKEQIEQAFTEISRQIEKKEKVREKFEADIDRFTFLTQPKPKRKELGQKPAENKVTDSMELSHKTAQNKAAYELGLYFCETAQQCGKAWESAMQFVRTYSTTALDIETDKLIMTQEPYVDADLNLSVSKMNMDNGKQQLFLDIRCFNSTLGDKLCSGKKVKKIRNSFSGYIKSSIER